MSKRSFNLPETASVANKGAGAKLCAPSAARNGEAIVQAMADFAPKGGKALEIASGTGEHMMRFGAAFPDLMWQPTDVAPERIASIDAWRQTAALPNIKPAMILDACTAGWALSHKGQNLIFLSNMLHLISDTAAKTVLSEAALALTAGGVLAIYGPFMRGEDFASEGDRRFHESLRAQDVEIGYKSIDWVQTWQESGGLKVFDPIEMPANNLILVAEKL